MNIPIVLSYFEGLYSASVCKFLREPPGGPVGVRSTERSEPRKVATRT